MSNVLTSLYHPAFLAVDRISRELSGFVTSAARNAKASGAAIGTSIDIPRLTSDAPLEDIVASMTIPTPSDTSLDVIKMQITNSKRQSFGFSGEEEAALNGDNAAGAAEVASQVVASAIRKLVNAMESDLAKAGAQGCSRAYGTAGTVPFSSASDLVASANLYKILADNGVSKEGRNLIISTSAGVNLRTLKGLQDASQSGTTDVMRQAIIGLIHGSPVKETGFPYEHIAGTASSKVVGSTAGVKGDTEITLTSAGSGTILVGDVIWFGSNTGDKYVVNSALASNKVGIARPGLRKAVAAGASVNLASDYEAGVLLGENSLVLAARTPKIPSRGDGAKDRFYITDPRTNLTFEFAVYGGYMMNNLQVSASWGVQSINDERSALLMG